MGGCRYQLSTMALLLYNRGSARRHARAGLEHIDMDTCKTFRAVVPQEDLSDLLVADREVQRATPVQQGVESVEPPELQALYLAGPEVESEEDCLSRERDKVEWITV